MTSTDLDALQGARKWGVAGVALCEGLNLSAFTRRCSAREGPSGAIGDRRAESDRAVAVATIDGVGSASEVDRLCDGDAAYRWIRGGVSVNCRTLSDFAWRTTRALDDFSPNRSRPCGNAG